MSAASGLHLIKFSSLTLNNQHLRVFQRLVDTDASQQRPPVVKKNLQRVPHRHPANRLTSRSAAVPLPYARTEGILGDCLSLARQLGVGEGDRPAAQSEFGPNSLKFAHVARLTNASAAGALYKPVTSPRSPARARGARPCGRQTP